MKVYSLNEENYYDYDDVADLISDESEEVTNIYEAEKVNYSHSDFIDIKLLIEDMKDTAERTAGEYAEMYFSDFTKKKIVGLKNLISKWLDENVTEPKFFTVYDVKKITLEEFNNIA